MACARTWLTPSSSCAAFSAAVSSSPITRSPVVSVDSMCERCSLPIIGRHGRGRVPSSSAASTSTVTPAAGPASDAAETASQRSPSTCTSDREVTEYHRVSPGVPVVSAYGGWGTASTSRPAWSTGSHGPSAVGAAYTW